MATTTLAVAQQNNILQQEYWDARLLEMIKLESSNFVFSNLGREVIIPKNEGTTTFSVRRYNSLPVRDIVNAPSAAGEAKEKLLEGEANAALKIEAQKVQASIDQFGAWIEITDHVKDIHMDDVKSIYQPELSRHAAEVKERNIINKFADASEYYVGGVALAHEQLASTNVLSLQELRKVALFMKIHRRQGHTKFGGKPVAVLHPYVMQDLLDDTDLKERLLVPGNDNMPIKIGTLEQYQFYGMFVIETLIAEETSAASVAANVKATLTNLQALGTSTTPAVAVGNIYWASTPKKFYKCATATTTSSTWTDLGGDFNVYTSYMLGKDPYIVTKLGTGAVEWKMTGFDASKDDPLGQKATFGYRMWTGAKVIDPVAITKIYSRSAYDVTNLVDVTDDYIATAGQ